MTELLEIFVTRPRNVVSGNASICTIAESPTVDARDVGLVDLHLRLEHAHVRDREQRGGVLVERARHRGLTLLDGETRHAPAHRRENGRLGEAALRVPELRLGLFDLVHRRLLQRLLHFGRGLQLLELLVGNELPRWPS